MSTDLKDRVVIVTGAGKGIGKEIAMSFAGQGARVVLAARTEADLKKVAEAISKSGGQALVVPTDVAEERRVERMVNETIRAFGRIDILVNNAGIGITANVVDMKTEDFDAMFGVNVRGLFLCTRAVLPFMIKQNDGVIVNISSLAGRNAMIGGAGYCATKWALIGFARSLMLEVRQHNIRIITVCPGSVDTSFSHLAKRKSNILLPEDVATTVLAAVRMPARAMVSEIDIRPTHPRS
jgi:3-oxoacyl-[acyl-carrier protein] reductase